MAEINIFCEDVEYTLNDKRKLTELIQTIIQKEKKLLDTLNIILCSDQKILDVNIRYLGHDYYTDVITFDSSDENDRIAGDIFISVERVYENAKTYDIIFENELFRVIIHGLLHLIGYNDKEKVDEILMFEKQEGYLSLCEF